MPRIKLTQLAADRQTATAKETIYWDAQLPGFGLRVSPKGKKVWIAMYRIKGGKERMETIGAMAMIPKVEQARDLARASMLKARAGVDPIEERRAAEAATAIAAFTFADLVQRYLNEHAERNTKASTVYETRRLLNRAVTAWPGRALRSITKADVNTLVEGIAGGRRRNSTRTKGGALVEGNAALRSLKTLFKWAMAKDLVEKDPTLGVLRPLVHEIARDRVLSDDEIKLFWSETDYLGWPYGPVGRLLLLTAQRQSEVAGMRRSELDLEQKVWTIPADRAKNGKSHTVHLTPMAIEVIEAVHNAGDLLFSTSGNKPVTNFTHPKVRLDQLMNSAAGPNAAVPHWVWHDLRRTATTGMARLGIAPHVADRVLNHTAGTIHGVAAVYNRFAYLDERKAALELWGRFVEALVRPTGPGNVVELRSA